MTTRVARQLLAAFGSGLVAFGYFLLGRDYPWPLALLMGAAIGALVFSTLGTGARLRGLSRRDRDE